MTEPKIHVSKFNSVDALGRYQYNNDPKMTDKEREEINSVYEADKKNGVTISTQPTAFGPSQALMEQKLKMYIRAGLVVDKNDDGEVNKFSNKNKRALGKEFETIHKEKGYTTDFTKIPENTEFNYTWDEFCRFVDAAGYKFVEQKPAPPKAPATPVTPDPVAAPAVDDKNVQAPPEPPVTPAPVEEQKNDKLDTVILDATTYTDENGNVIADDTKALVNGQPYHSRTGFNTFGTLTPDPVDWKQYSMKDLEKLDGAPTGKKVTTNPDSVPTAPASDKGSAAAPQITVPEAPVVGNEPVMPAPKTEAPVTTEVKAQPPVEAKNDEASTPVAVNKPVTPAPKTEAPVTPELKAQPPVEAKNDETPTPVAVNKPVTPAPKTETPAVASEPKTAQEKFEADLAADSELASADGRQRAQILDKRVSTMQQQVANLKKPTIVIKKGFLGLGHAKTKVLKTAEENTATNKDQITALEQNIDKTKKLKAYADVATQVGTMFASSSFVDDKGNKIAEYPQHTVVKYKNANGEESYAAKVENYNKETHKWDSSYYAFDVQQIRDVKGAEVRWQAVPDMKNPLTDGQEVR